ncbi:MAG: hypothetical protein ACI85F_002313 [Bacteroidia bacterium]|jgi:hypothetical protein
MELKRRFPRLIGLVLFVTSYSHFAWSQIPIPPMISEIMYDSPRLSDDSLEFIEIYSTVNRMMDGEEIRGDIYFRFPDEYIMFAGYLIVARDSVAFERNFGLEAFQWDTSILPDQGGLLVFMDSIFYYNHAPWPENANGTGASIGIGDAWHYTSLGENWCESSNNTGIVIDGITIYADPGEFSNCNSTEIIEIVEESKFKIFPNPSDGQFNLNLPVDLRQKEIQILDLSGKLMHQCTVNAGSTTKTFNLNLESGCYILKAFIGESIITEFLIISSE